MCISETPTRLLIYRVSSGSLHALYGPGGTCALSRSSTSSPDNMGGKIITIVAVLVVNIYRALCARHWTGHLHRLSHLNSSTNI